MTRMFVGGKEVAQKTTAYLRDHWESPYLDHPGTIYGGRSMEGSFSAPLTQEVLDVLQPPDGVTHVVLYGPKDGNRLQRLWWRFRQWRGHEWPTRVIAQGDAYVDFTARDVGGEGRIDGTFKSTGNWEIDP